MSEHAQSADGTAPGPASSPAGGRGVAGRLADRWRALSDGLREFYVAPYRRTFAKARRDEDDLFRMLVMSEMLGVPNPASSYTLELLPVLYDGFHDWHRRMGMERSPLENYRCC